MSGAECFDIVTETSDILWLVETGACYAPPAWKCYSRSEVHQTPDAYSVQPEE